MSVATHAAPYRRVLGAAPARWVLVGGVTGRFREAGTGLALVLAVRGVHGSFALAGFASAAFLVGAATTRPLHGRWVDRRGPRAPLLCASAANAACLVAVALAASRGAPAWTLIALSASVGLTLPALSAAMRALWPRLAPTEIESALALDTLGYELSLIASPVLVGLVAAAASPSWALLVIAGLGVTGTAVVAVVASAARAPSSGDAHRGGRALTARVMALMAVSLCVGAAEGSMVVLAPGVASARHDHAVAGLLLAALAAGSLVGALSFGVLRGRDTPTRRLAIGTVGLTISLALVGAFGGQLAGFAITAALAGFALSPTLTLGFIVLREIAAGSSLTEAFTWASLAATAGAAASQALGGLLIAGPGIGTALWLPAVAAAGAALAAVGVSRRSRS